MANNNLEKYLEAILDKIADGTETDIPRPSWNIEKYLAAIYEALSEGGGGGGGGSTGGGVLVVHSEEDDDGIISLDATWQDIHDADYAVLKQADQYGCEWSTITLSFDDNDDEKYYAHVGAREYHSDTADGVLMRGGHIG